MIRAEDQRAARRMRWGLVGAALMSLIGGVASRASGQSAPPRDSAAAALAFLEADAQTYLQRMLEFRRLYLARAGWADLGDRCNVGDLRVFPRDTASAQQDSVQRLVERMESTVIARGVGARLDTPDARSLLRVIVGWEAGIDRPSWDADDPTPRRAVAAGLTGEVADPRSDGCLPSPLASDTVTFVLPGFSTMAFPGAPEIRVKAYFGPTGQQRARDEFYTAVGSRNPDAALSYILVAPVVIWRDWALVGVRRPREQRGVELGAVGNGGAAYLFRRVAGEWRLLSVVRSWGS